MSLKKLILGLALALAIPTLASAHTATLTFTKSVDDTGATGSGYTAWRQSGSCPANVTSTTGFTALNSTLFTGATYLDSTVVPGTYCYVVTFTAASASSIPSNTGAAIILPATATNVTIGNVN